MTALTGVLLPAVAANKTRKQRAEDNKKATVVRKPITETKWKELLGVISTGATLPTALKQLKIYPSALEAHLSADKKAKSQLDDAKIKALRATWSEDMLEDVLVSIAMGATVTQACRDANMAGNIETFYRLMLRDPTMKEAYDEARMIQAEKMAIDDIIEISDETENDETWDGKGNAAAVNRARLKVDSRKWIAGKLNFKRFGDKQQVDLEANIIVDHAARLEEARKRKEAAHKK